MDISQISLRHLRYFVAVAEELSFSRAAKRLNLSQPPLSQQILAMETTLGTPLFTRTKRSVVLTDAGTWLLPAARKLLSETHSMMIQAQAAGRGDVGELRIGTNFSSPINPRFSKIISTFRTKHPAIRLIMHETLFDQAVRGVQDGTLDLGLTWPISFKPIGDVHFHLIGKDQLFLCMPRNHRLATKPKLEITDLKDELIMLSGRQTQTECFLQLQKRAREAGFLLHTSLDSVHFPITINMVSAGYGLSILPEFMGSMAHRGVVFRPLPAVKPAICQLPFVIAYNRKKAGQLVKNFLDIAAQLRNKEAA